MKGPDFERERGGILGKSNIANQYSLHSISCCSKGFLLLTRFKSIHHSGFNNMLAFAVLSLPISLLAFFIPQLKILFFSLLSYCPLPSASPWLSQFCQGLLPCPSIPQHSWMYPCNGTILYLQKLMWYGQITFLLYFLISLSMTSP